MQLSVNAKIVPAFTTTEGAAAATAITGATIDTQGYGRVCFVVPVGTVVAGAVTSIKVQHDDASGMGTVADVVGSSQTIADTDDNTTRYVDFKPTKRYVRLYVSRATQNATFGGATAILTEPFSAPVTQPGTVTGEAIASAITGTA